MHRKVLHACRLAARLEVEQQDTSQHEDATEERVQQEFPGRVYTPRHSVFGRIVAPDADQEEHGRQLDFPEKEEEQEVKRKEDAHHACLQDQQQGHVFFHPWLLPAADDCQH